MSMLLKPMDFMLDIETTGLNASRDSIICIGVLYQQPKMIIYSKQWLSSNQSDEKNVLVAFLEWCQSYKKVYTYNGNVFDIPFILTRLSYYGLCTDLLKQIVSIDMKKKLFKLSAKRASIESLIGYQRQTSSTGKELITCYKLFAKTGQKTYKALILNHSLDELSSLRAMYEVYKTLSCLSQHKMTSMIRSDHLIILYLQNPFHLNTSCLFKHDEIEVSWKSESDVIAISFFLHTLTLKKYLSPAKDYFYIPSQNQLMHRSLAQFIPRELKKRVSMQQCFITKASFFIKLYTPHKVEQSIWHNDNGELFIEYEESTDMSITLLV